MIFTLAVGIWQNLPTKPALAAALAPLSSVYIDLDNNGEVDTVRLTFTDITACTYEADDWAVGVAGTITVTGVTGFSNSGTCVLDDFIDVTVTVSTTDVTGGAINPRLDYTDAVTAGSVVADTNQDAANFTATDAAQPIILSGVYSSAGLDGEVDRVIFTTSADTGIACTAFTGATDFTVSVAGTVVVASALGDTCASNGTSTVTISLATDGAANPTRDCTINCVQGI